MTPAQKTARRVAVVVAHPDDEVLGCGGTIRRHILAGDEVWVVILADGETSREGASGGKVVAEREAAAHAAARILGVQHLAVHRFADNRLDTNPLLDIIRVVEQHIREISPETVYTHHAGDLNIDHRRTHEATPDRVSPAIEPPGHPDAGVRDPIEHGMATAVRRALVFPQLVCRYQQHPRK